MQATGLPRAPAHIVRLKDIPLASDSIDEIFYMPDDGGKWNPLHTVHAVSHLARKEDIQRSLRWMISIWNWPPACASIFESPEWARRRLATSATSWRCG